MSSIAPVANFDGLIRKTGLLMGFPTDPESGAPISFDDALLNVSVDPTLSNRVYTNVGPQFVGIGNALKIYITYMLTSRPQNFEAWVNLCWIQRVKSAVFEGNSNYTVDLPSRTAKEVVRGWEDTHENEQSASHACNKGIFYDTALTRTVSGDIDDLEVRDQRIKLTFADPPFDVAALDLPTNGSSGWTRGVVYECLAKTDELYLVMTTSDDTYRGGATDDFVSIDIAIGSNAQGDQI